MMTPEQTAKREQIEFESIDENHLVRKIEKAKAQSRSNLLLGLVYSLYPNY